jgi:hypothetical protein
MGLEPQLPFLFVVVAAVVVVEPVVVVVVVVVDVDVDGDVGGKMNVSQQIENITLATSMLCKLKTFLGKSMVGKSVSNNDWNNWLSFWLEA